MSRYGSSQFSSLLKDCVLWWPGSHCAGYSGDFDEFPIIPSGVTVTNYGTWTKDDLGNNKSMLNFDGSTNYISLSDNNAWDIWNGDLTICCWIKQITSKYQYIYNQYASSSDTAKLQIGTSNVFSSKVGNSYIFNYSWEHTFTVGEWYHVTLTKYSTTPGIWCIYVNGIQLSITTGKAFTGTTINISGPVYIGRNVFSNINANVNIKDLFIYKNRALTQPEIKLLMNRTHPITGRGLIDSGRYYRLS